MACLYSVVDGKVCAFWGYYSWTDCADLFELDPFCRTEDRPEFESGPSGSSIPEAVLIVLGVFEARQHGLEPGYFVSPLDGMAAMVRLHGQYAPVDGASAVAVDDSRPARTWSEGRWQELPVFGGPPAVRIAPFWIMESREQHRRITQRSRRSIDESRALLAQIARRFPAQTFGWSVARA